MNKKVLIALLLVFSMLTQLVPMVAAAPPAGAVSDVKGTVYERAISRLNSLGIMVGDEGGFRPNDSIKRSEFAAVVVRALGVELSAGVLSGVTKFEDVPSEHWASGYVKVATETGIIKGMSDTQFAPDDDVTYEQAVTMIIRALGYEDEANFNGGYPTGFMIAAYNLDLFRNIPDFGKQTDVAIRGMVGFMLDNALEIPLMINYGAAYLYASTGLTTELATQTLLESRMRINKYECIINDIKFGDYDTKLVFTVTKSREISYVGRKMECRVPDYLSSDLNFLRDVNSIISVYERDGEIFGIRSESEVIFDYVQDINGKNKTGEINSEVGDNFNKIENIKLKTADRTHPLRKTENGTNDLNISDIRMSTVTGEVRLNAPSELLGRFVKTVIKNGSIVYIHAYNLEEGGRITDTSASGKIDYTRIQSDNLSVRRTMDNEQLLVLLDNKPAGLNDVQRNHVFDYYKHQNILIIVASSRIEEDKLTSYNEKDNITTIKFGDIAYDLSITPPVYYSVDGGATYSPSIAALDSIAGNKCTAYVDAKGEVRFIVANSGLETEPFYGLVTGHYTDEFNYLKIYKFNQDGSFKTSSVVVKDAETFKKAVESYENMQKKADWPSYNGEGQYYYSATLNDANILGKFIPNNKGEIIEIRPLENSGWVTGPVSSADTRTNSLFSGDSRYTESGINPGGNAMPNRITKIDKNYITFALTGTAGLRVNFANDTKVIGIWEENGEVNIKPVSSTQLANKTWYDIIGMKFHVKQIYSHNDVANGLVGEGYNADFIIIYGIDGLSRAGITDGFVSDLERISNQYYTAKLEEATSAAVVRNVLLKRDWIEGFDIIEYMRSGSQNTTLSLSGNAFVSCWTNMLNPVDNVTISVDNAIKIVGIARESDIKKEFENARNGKPSVVERVYEVEENNTYFTLSDSKKYVIDSNIVVYEYDPYEGVFEFSSYNNISRYDYVMRLVLPKDELTKEFVFKRVIFQKR